MLLPSFEPIYSKPRGCYSEQTGLPPDSLRLDDLSIEERRELRGFNRGGDLEVLHDKLLVSTWRLEHFDLVNGLIYRYSGLVRRMAALDISGGSIAMNLQEKVPTEIIDTATAECHLCPHRERSFELQYQDRTLILRLTYLDDLRSVNSPISLLSWCGCCDEFC